MIFSSISKFLAASLLLISLSGCGTNLFETFDSTSFSGNPDDLLNNAESAEDYAEIVDLAEEIINDPESTDEEVFDAYYTQSEAILGKNDISTLDLFGDLADSSEEGVTDSILELLDLEVDNDALLASAEAIQNAEDLLGTGNATADQELMKGVVNTMIIVNSVNTVFEVNEDGELEENSASENFSWADALEDFVYPEGPGEDAINVYSDSAASGFEDSGTLNDDQNEQIGDLVDAMDDVVEVQEAIEAGNSSYTLDGETYDFSQTGDDLDDEIEAALNSIFGDLGD